MSALPLSARWQQLSPRERAAVVLAAALVAGALIWWLLLAPALTVLRQADERQARWTAQWDQVQALAAQARALRADGTPPPPREASVRALEQATQALGPTARLSLQGDQATVQLNGTAPDALAQWLAQVRINARVVPTQARLQRTPTGWTGQVQLAGPGLEAAP